jgi:hypothetical protein
MAKRFLDILGDAFEDDVLTDLIPKTQKAVPRSAPAVSKKKSFVETMKQSLPMEKSVQKPVSASSQPRRLTLLDAMEEALDSNLFDEIVPPASRNIRKGQIPDQFDPPQVEKPFHMMLTAEVLERAREIALAKGMRVKDVINAALKVYVEQEWEKLFP